MLPFFSSSQLVRFCFGLILCLVLAPPAQAQSPSLSVDQKNDIEGIIKDYLLKNPEVIQQALTELDRKQQTAQKTALETALKQEAPALFAGANGVVVGNPQGDVTLVEFFDYNCGFCKQAFSDIEALVKEDPKLKLVLRDFPVLGPDSVEASKVALAVKNQRQGKDYWEFHSKLLKEKGRADKESALKIATSLGINTSRLVKDMEGEPVMATIRDTMRVGDALALTGTPAFVLGDEIIFGVTKKEDLKQAIAAVRQCGKTTC